MVRSCSQRTRYSRQQDELYKQYEQYYKQYEQYYNQQGQQYPGYPGYSYPRYSDSYPGSSGRRYVTPLSLGIETVGGVFNKLIEHNTTIPITQSKIFTTAASFQSSVEINVLQGERPLARQNKSLGKFKLNGIRRAPRGVPKIEVTFTIDTNGIVSVSARDLDTGKHQEITIQGSSNMSREEIDRAIRKAQQYASEDARAKDEAQAKDRLESLIYRSEEVRKNMDKEQKKTVDDAVKNAKKALKHKDSQEMLDAAARLEELIGQVNSEM